MTLKRLKWWTTLYETSFEDWQIMMLRSKLAEHFEHREWQNLLGLTALWITRKPQPPTPKITITWKVQPCNS